jgi:hypothetical protein
VFEQLSASDFPDLAADDLARASKALGESGIMEIRDSWEPAAIRARFGAAVQQIVDWRPTDASKLSAIGTICAVAGSEIIARSVMMSIKKSLEDRGEAEGARSGSGSALANGEEILLAGALAGLCGELRELGFGGAIPESLVLPITAGNRIRLFSYIATHREVWWPRFECLYTFDELLTGWTARIDDLSIADEDIRAMPILKQEFTNRDWDPAVDAIDPKLSVTERADSQKIRILLKWLAQMSADGSQSAAKSLLTIASNGGVLHWLQFANEQEDEETLAICAAIFMHYRPNLTQPSPPRGTSAAGYQKLMDLVDSDDSEFARALLASLREVGELSDIVRIVDEHRPAPLLRTCLRIVADEGEILSVLSVETFVDRWAEFRGYLNGDDRSRFESTVSSLVLDADLARIVRESPFATDRAGLYIVISDTAVDGDWVRWCSDGLNSLTDDTWREELSGGDVLSLALTQGQRGLKLRGGFQDALVELAKEYLTGGSSITGLETHKSDLFAVCEKREVLRTRLLDEACDRDGACDNAFFEFFGDELMDAKSLQETSHVVTRLFSPLVRERKIGGIVWLTRTLGTQPQLLHALDEAQVEDFRDRIRDSFGATDIDQETRAQITELGRAIGVEPPELID